MTAAIDTVRINGKVHSWNSTEFTVDGNRFYGFTSISYGDKKEGQLVYTCNTSYAPYGITSGKYEPGKLSLSGPIGPIEELREFVSTYSSNRNSYGDAVIPIAILKFIEDNRVIVKEFFDLQWCSESSSHSESADALSVDIEFAISRILHNGKSLYRQE